MGTAPIGRMGGWDEEDHPEPDYVTVLGYWYHTCPVTKVQRRIGHNRKIVVNGKCPPYEKCYLCGRTNPAAKDSEILRGMRRT